MITSLPATFSTRHLILHFFSSSLTFKLKTKGGMLYTFTECRII